MTAASKRERLLILGASVRAAAQSAARAGYDVIAADPFADRDLRAICPDARPVKYSEGLLAFAMSVDPCAWMYTGGLENYPEIIATVSQRHELLGNGAEELRKLRDPQALAAFAEAHGYSFPETRRERPADDRAWLHKRIASSGGLGIRLAKAESVLAEGEYFQEWIEGTPCSAAFLASNKDTHFLFASEQLVDVPCLGAPKFHYAGNRIAAPSEGIDFPRLGRELASTLGLRGLFGVDFILREGRPWLLEINPRYTASMELWERATGRSLIEMHVRACRGESMKPPPDLSRSERSTFAKAILYSRSDGLITDRLSDRLWALRTELDLADLPMGGSAIGKGHPVLTIFAKGQTCEETMQSLEAKANQLRALGIP